MTECIRKLLKSKKSDDRFNLDLIFNLHRHRKKKQIRQIDMISMLEIRTDNSNYIL